VGAPLRTGEGHAGIARAPGGEAASAATSGITRRREAAKTTALAIALAALDKKAERVEIVDISEKVDYADYLVVMTGRSDRQVVAIAQGIEEALEKTGVKTVGMEGLSQGHWVLIDYGDVIVHVFLDEARRFYDLEGLWIDAPRVPTPSFVAQPSAREG
jgi:ribosome-associated protein